MELFDIDKNSAPLAERMRPQTLDEILGQEQILSKGTLLYRAIQADLLSSTILWGPPGTGKTTIAKIIANMTKAHFAELNATHSGKSDIANVVDGAQHRLAMQNQKTILFIDEIHRFNKAQQDTLLPHVERGIVILIGATTENPYYELNDALISRSRIFRLNPLGEAQIQQLLKRALTQDSILKQQPIHLSSKAREHFAHAANGDVRNALNALELASLTTEKTKGKIEITLSVAEECIQQKALRYDKNGDSHYDTISAYILSVRGSDVDAALYYMLQMLEAGEDPKFIARRLIVCASEEVGMADPQALVIASHAAHIVEFVGMPECLYALAQATIYVTSVPKSDSVYQAIQRVKQDIHSTNVKAIPLHIRDFLNRHTEKTGNGKGYKNAHHYQNHFVHQQYLPDELVGRSYYRPNSLGKEKYFDQWLQYIKQSPDSKET
ncbi:replication-associated recombination protein A [Vibrio sp. SM6]|uniref:Replication-associated recombination protein A n=1 Tax=Vibrio agarilyticus TaxID=2726741 RepID=A0A7X8YFN1_9VIBR|nr:replication-associated recombination protein A [Vibrio agarilyticus]NLS11725.1 replication-associated recombination protein A [Vibrio agarilyticus]